MDPTQNPQCGTRKHVGWYTLMVFLAALGWRLSYTLTVQTFFLDETAFAHPTIEQILDGGFPIYLYSNAYMAPVQEWMAAGFINAWGASLAALRLPCVLCGCLAIALIFFNLTRIVRTGVALTLVIPLICSNSFTGIYTTFGIPSYAVAMLCAALIQWAAPVVERRRTWLAWAAFGVLGGLSTYVFKIIAIQFGVALVWLLMRSRAWQETVDALQDSTRRRLKKAGAIAGIGLLAVAAVAYRYLTRVETYQRSTLDMAVLGFGVLALLLAVWLSRGEWRGRASEWGRVAVCVLLAAATYLPWEIYFRVYEKPRIAAAGIKLWEGSRYMLKHAHEWPFQVQLFLERVFATFLTGRVHELGGGYATSVSLGWRAALSGGFFAILLGAAGWRFARGERPDWKSPRWLFIAPCFAVIAIMLPAWQLNNDWCGRYLIPFQVGLWLAVYWVFQPWLDRRPWVGAVFVGLYAVYCGLDTFWHTPL